MWSGTSIGNFGPIFSNLLTVAVDFSNNVFVNDHNRSVYIISSNGITIFFLFPLSFGFIQELFNPHDHIGTIVDIISSTEGTRGITVNRNSFYYMTWGLFQSTNSMFLILSPLSTIHVLFSYQ